MLERARDALADRQAQAEAALAAGAGLIEAAELVEDLRQVVLGNAGAGVPHLQFDRAIAHARGDQHAAFARVAQRIGEEVLQRAAQQAAVAAHRPRRVRRAHAQLQSASGGDRRVLRDQLAQQFVDVEVDDLDAQRAGVQARDVEQAVEQVLGGAQRGIDALGQARLLARVAASRAARWRTGARH